MRRVLTLIIVLVVMTVGTSCASPQNGERALEWNYETVETKANGLEVFLTDDTIEEIVERYEKDGATVIKRETVYALLETNSVRITIVPNDFNDDYKWAIIKIKK